MIRFAPSRGPLTRTLLMSAAIATGVLAGSLAPAVALADGPASATRTMDAEAEPTVYIGVRQAAVGDPIPVTVTGSTEGAVWDIAIVTPSTILGTLTVGSHGTGTTMVSLPVGTSPGSVEIVATTDGDEISTALSSAGDTASGAEALAEEAGPDATGDGAPIGPLIVGGAAMAAVIAATSAVVIVRRKRRTSH